MTTAQRVALAAIALVLAALLAIGMWGEPPQLSDDDYVSIALSQPDVFRERARGFTTRVTHRDTWVEVELTSDGRTVRVLIDPRTNRVTQVIRE